MGKISTKKLRRSVDQTERAKGIFMLEFINNFRCKLTLRVSFA